jgi:hypothetical protein
MVDLCEPVDRNASLNMHERSNRFPVRGDQFEE